MRRPNYPLVALIATAVLATSGCGGKSAAKMGTVPRVPARNVVQAYQLLHAAGLRVAVQRDLGTLTHDGYVISLETKPGAGASVKPGSIVTIGPGRIRGYIDYGLPPLWASRRPAPAAMPDFVEKPLSVLDRWAAKRHLPWFAYEVPETAASGRASYIENFLVERQSPAPGTEIHWTKLTAREFTPSGYIEIRLALRLAD